MLRGYSKIPPGHWAEFNAATGDFIVQRYWEAPYQRPHAAQPTKQQNFTKDEWKSKLRESLTDAVRLRMRSDVPFGAFLSGGVDSTIITGLMQQLSEQKVHTFSIGFSEKKFDERSFARSRHETGHRSPRICRRPFGVGNVAEVD